ncbi:MAG: hypothetical protein U9R68_10020 [Planctomycetota bacterium]|nr:hypothetical protein [Planctomycetota bacterium]
MAEDVAEGGAEVDASGALAGGVGCSAVAIGQVVRSFCRLAAASGQVASAEATTSPQIPPARPWLSPAGWGCDRRTGFALAWNATCGGYPQ